jgi:uncharacterized membrane protein
MKVFRWLWLYLKDWKNLLAHTIIGVVILLIALYLPVNIEYRIGTLLLVVAFNIIRMRILKKKSEAKKEN